MMERRKNLNDKFGFVEIMEYTSIGESCSVVSGGTPSRSKNEYWENGNIPWIKIGNIKSKYVNEYDELITEQGLNNSSAKLLKKGTILYTIFATLGEVGILDIEACTNQAIAGINITDPRITTDYLYYYLKSKKDYVNNIGRGVAQNNINLTTLKNFEIPLIDVDKQLNIVEILEKVERMICLKEKEIDDLDLLIKARFIEMFGDPVSNSKHLTLKTLPQLGAFGRGVSKYRPRNAPELLNGPYPLIQTGDIANSELYIKNYNNTYSEVGLKQSKMWDKGTLCITIAANIAKTAILQFDACFPDSVVGFNGNNLTNNIFVHYWFSFFQEILENQAPESAQKNINLKILSELQIITPDIIEQNQFADFVQQVDKSREEVKKSLEKTQQLYDSLMQEYFG